MLSNPSRILTNAGVLPAGNDEQTISSESHIENLKNAYTLVSNPEFIDYSVFAKYSS